MRKFEESYFNPISAKQVEMESIIIYTFEINGSCSCNDNENKAIRYAGYLWMDSS